MTPQETMNMVNMLLDDSVAWYVPGRELINCINKAQLIAIEKAHKESDERALRPLYVSDNNLTSGAFLSRRMLYPRVCRLYDPANSTTVTGDYDSLKAEYVPFPVYDNISTYTIDIQGRMPMAAIWTYTLGIDPTDGLFKPRIFFTEDTLGLFPLTLKTARVTYIAYPPAFTFTGNPATDIALSLPQEYHLEVCAMAAEFANDIDVGEEERGEHADYRQGQKVTIGTAGGVE